MAAVRLGLRSTLKVCKEILKWAAKYQDKWDDYLDPADIEKLQDLISCAQIVLDTIVPPEA